jgi:hypothetical protein
MGLYKRAKTGYYLAGYVIIISIVFGLILKLIGVEI